MDTGMVEDDPIGEDKNSVIWPTPVTQFGGKLSFGSKCIDRIISYCILKILADRKENEE